MIGLILIAVGAILVWAVNVTSSQVDVNAIGWILMGVGLVSFLIELIFFDSTWGRLRDRR